MSLTSIPQRGSAADSGRPGFGDRHPASDSLTDPPPVAPRAVLTASERAAVDAARVRATELLESLLTDRTLIETRLSSGGRIDPMKCVRGASSIESAISTTREMIAAYDAMLGGS